FRWRNFLTSLIDCSLLRKIHIRHVVKKRGLYRIANAKFPNMYVLADRFPSSVLSSFTLSGITTNHIGYASTHGNREIAYDNDQHSRSIDEREAETKDQGDIRETSYIQDDVRKAGDTKLVIVPSEQE
ncbi:MAG: hypothetical protein JSW01_02960, partial [Candidatus Bathyarchaeota archaeon]